MGATDRSALIFNILGMIVNSGLPGGKMNAACMFWDSKGNKTLSYNPESRNWKAISTDEEFARARAVSYTHL